jgi:hypothetical protein
MTFDVTHQHHCICVEVSLTDTLAATWQLDGSELFFIVLFESWAELGYEFGSFECECFDICNVYLASYMHI